MNSIRVNLPSTEVVELLRQRLAKENWELVELPLSHGTKLKITADSSKTTLAIYEKKNKSTTLVFEGDVPSLREKIVAIIRTINLAEEQDLPYIGTDESGKGDYFGPLVVAGVFVDQYSLGNLISLGVGDSKEISDRLVKEQAKEIKRIAPFSLVVIGPKRYNELYERIRNLNRLLAWGHARVIENLLKKIDCEKVITDQFGDERFVLNALMEKGKKVKLKQKPQAETATAVAAASIIARAEFLKRLHFLSQEVGMSLPKGASKDVIQTARKLVSEQGSDVLREVTKLHFKTTKKIY